MTNTPVKLAFIGFGEAGQAFASGVTGANAYLTVAAFDIKRDGPEADSLEQACEATNARNAATSSDACSGSDLVFSLVTADAAERAAETAATHGLTGQLFLDCNSCAPSAKRRSATRIDAAGGRYVDVAVMTPVHPKLHEAPCLLAGPHAEAAKEQMDALGMQTQIAGPNVGDASTRKMIRSTMIKGLEALTLECFLAARKAGIETDILASLEGSFPSFDWAKRAPYMIERAMTHGTRRAAEMRAVAQTLEDLGIVPSMTRGTVDRQAQMGALGLDANAIGPQDLGALTDAILAALDADET